MLFLSFVVPSLCFNIINNVNNASLLLTASKCEGRGTVSKKPSTTTKTSAVSVSKINMDKTGQIYSERRFKKVLMCHHNLLWHIVTVREQLSVTVIILFLCSDCRGVFFSTTKYTFSSFFPFKKKGKKNQMMIRLSVSSSGAPFSFTAHGRMTPTRRERAALIGVVCSRSSFANETAVKMKRDLASRKWLDWPTRAQRSQRLALTRHLERCRRNGFEVIDFGDD